MARRVRPPVPAQDPLGQLAIRRITDATDSTDPLAAIKSRLKGYTAGDTDLAWSRITYWRALLATALDQAPFEPINSALVSGLKDGARTRHPGRLAGEPDRRSGAAGGRRPEGRAGPSQRDDHAEPAADGRDRHADPHRQAGSADSVGPQGRQGMPGRGPAPARRRRDLPRGARRASTRCSTYEHRHREVLRHRRHWWPPPATDWSTRSPTRSRPRDRRADRADRRRHRHRAARSTSASTATRSTGRRSTCSGATNATCPPTTTTATRSRPARRCSTTSTSPPPTCMRCPPATASSATTSTRPHWPTNRCSPPTPTTAQPTPDFDVHLLGMGGEGHINSLFPHTAGGPRNRSAGGRRRPTPPSRRRSESR